MNEPATADRLGLCEWFHYGDHARVESAAATMRDLGVRHLRTGLSWADFHRPDGPAWMAFLFDTLAEFEVLPSLWHTPPSISENGACSGPPVRLEEFAEFTGYMIELYGHRFGQWVELWNEPNGRYYWDFVNHDPLWHKFGTMIAGAAAEVKRQGRRAMLGGLAPADPTFITLLADRGNLDDVDGISVHGFPEMWGDGHRDTSGGTEKVAEWDEPWRWRGWDHRLAEFRAVAGGRPVWVTETGFSTWTPPPTDPDGEDAAADDRLTPAGRRAAGRRRRPGRAGVLVQPAGPAPRPRVDRGVPRRRVRLPLRPARRRGPAQAGVPRHASGAARRLAIVRRPHSRRLTAAAVTPAPVRHRLRNELSAGDAQRPAAIRTWPAGRFASPAKRMVPPQPTPPGRCVRLPATPRRPRHRPHRRRPLMPKRTDLSTILIIGSGPIVIGQGCEFDYSGTQACKALREEGYRVVLVNSNPATIMTDPQFADCTYIEPITPEAVEKIIARHNPRGSARRHGGARRHEGFWKPRMAMRHEATSVAETARAPGSNDSDPFVPTCLNASVPSKTSSAHRRRPPHARRARPPSTCACALVRPRGVFEKYGVEMIGADREVIYRAEDRQLFKQVMESRSGCAVAQERRR